MSNPRSKFTIKYDSCYFCGRNAHGVHHLLFGKDRQYADDDGIFVPICDECHILGHPTQRIHDNSMAEDLSKMLGEAMWVAYDIADGDREVVDDSIQKFRKRYGRSYL